MLQSVYRHELETKLSQKPWKQGIAKIQGWPRRKVVAEFRLFVGHDCLGTHLHRHDCLGTHLHRIGIRPAPYCRLCSFRGPVDRNHLVQSTALLNTTYVVRAILGDQDKNDGKLNSFPFYYYFREYSLSLGTEVVQWLRCCATNRKVAGSIPDGVIGIFPDRTMALGSTQPLTEMSTRRISWG